MTRNRDFLGRYIFIGVLFVVVCIIYISIFIDLQVSGQNYYMMTSPITYRTRTEKIQAQRGEIYDRNGKKLVGNEYSYTMKLDYGSMPRSNSEKNDVLLALIATFEKTGESGSLSSYRYTPFDVTAGSISLIFEYNSDFFELARSSKYSKLATELNIAEDATAEEAGSVFMKRYGLVDSDGKLLYSPDTAKILFEYRMDFDITDFSSASPYTFAEDISLDVITLAEESGIRGFTVYCDFERTYNYPGYASHILGRIGKISEAKVEYYTELGYSLDATVGTSGVEEAFENYLHGVDGEITVYEDSYGNIIKTEVTKEPVAGMDVYLTIDIDLQIAAEDALAYNIEFVHEEAKYSNKQYSGEDAAAGALTAVNSNTGEVLVLASYPTYDLSTFMEDYPYLTSDQTAPMVNRALDGTYQPGSTFKPGVAAAALDSNIITPYTTINATGQYEFYDSYQPRCWIYLMYGMTHGRINVTEAIQESCNYFFYDIGRQLTIEKLSEYMRNFGLGEPTGIELPEKTGVLAGPDYRGDNGLEPWAPGDTLQASIGQSDHLFSPLQITMYISTLVNDGVRNSAHILYKVCPYESEETVYMHETTVQSSMDISAEACSVVRSAMKNVIENGSASEMFEDYPITIGGKTGTAQVSSTKSDNAIFTAFAPFDDPEIVATCVIEQGNTGSNAGVAVKGLFDRYFSLGSYAESDSEESADTESNGTN